MAVVDQDIVARLRCELERTRGELVEYTEEATHPPEVELGGGSAGYSTWQTAVVVKRHIEHRIEELEEAIRRAEAGLYGVCEMCGERIPVERMEALPFTTLCVKCASRAPN
jgi:DnaK suppressor protein